MATSNDNSHSALQALLDNQHPVKMETAAWARENIDPTDMFDRDRDSTFAREAWRACADHGLQGSTIPCAFGGRGNDLVTTTLRLEGLGLGCRDTGLGFAIASQILSFQDAILRFGSDDQKAEHLPGIASGERIGAFAITEPESGSDSYNMASTAVLDGDHYVLSGHKAHITLAPVSDLIVFFARTNPDAGAWGLSAFIVRTDRPGVECTENHEKMGLRTTPFGDIVLDGYRAPVTDRLGPEGAGVSIFTTCMEAERGLIFATQIGAAERILGEAIARANTRKQFGQPIGSFQAVSHRLTEMKVAHETARLHLYKTAAMIDAGERATLAAAMSKLVASEAVASIGLDAARIHGARGYVSQYEVERDVRDALGGLVYSGTSDIQRNLIASLLGVGRGSPS